jgi:periplasmic copper chaperone A
MRKAFVLILIYTVMLTACSSKQLSINDAWARTGSTGGNSAIYMVIDNPLDQDDVLLSAKSNAAEAVELHLSKMSDEGAMMMQQQENLPVPADSKVELKPGGFHIMLINLKHDIKAGETFPVTLTFQNAGEVTIDVPIRNP